MAKRKGRTRGPQTLATQAQYLLNQRRVKLWIPYLEARISELQALVQDKGGAVAEEPPADHE